MNKIYSAVVFGILFCLFVILVGLALAPKTHQGFYMIVGSTGLLPEYRIYNNWRFYPDDVAFTTRDEHKAAEILKSLNIDFLALEGD